MKAKIEIADYHPCHLEQLKRLFRDHFGIWAAERMVDRWAWQYEGTARLSNQPASILLALANERVVGHISGAPIPVTVYGESRTVLASSGLVCDPSYRWVAPKLLRELSLRGPLFCTAMAPTVAALLGCAGAIAIPGTDTRLTLRMSSAGDLARRLRNRMPARLAPLMHRRLLKPFFHIPHKRKRDFLNTIGSSHDNGNITRIKCFDHRTDELWAMLKPRFSFSVDRSARYLNWRYFALPGAKPLAIVATDASGTVLGMAVVMERFELDRHRQPAATHLEITEFLLAEDDPELADHLIIFILRHAQELAVDSVGTMPITAFIQSRLKALGFTSEESTQFRAMLLEKKTQDMPQLIDTEIMYTAGDGDSIYVTGR